MLEASSRGEIRLYILSNDLYYIKSVSTIHSYSILPLITHVDLFYLQLLQFSSGWFSFGWVPKQFNFSWDFPRFITRVFVGHSVDPNGIRTSVIFYQSSLSSVFWSSAVFSLLALGVSFKISFSYLHPWLVGSSVNMALVIVPKIGN